MADAETGRVALIRFSAPDGIACVGSGLLVNHRAVLTADHVADGSDHQVACKGRTHEIAQVLRSGSPDVDLAILILKKPIADVTPLSFARVDRDRVSQIRNCVAVGFPRWKRDGNVRKSAQVNGAIPTAEGLEQTADQGLREGFLTLIGNREPAEPPTHPGPVTEVGTRSPWGGMSGAVVTTDSSVIGVIRSINLAAGSQSLTVTPLTAIENLPDKKQSRKFWNALSVPDPENLPRLPEIRTATTANENNALKLLLARQRGTTVKVGAEALTAGLFLGSVHSAHQHETHSAPATDTHRDSTTSVAGGPQHADAASHQGLAPDDGPHHDDVQPTDDSLHADPGFHDIGTGF